MASALSVTKSIESAICDLADERRLFYMQDVIITFVNLITLKIHPNAIYTSNTKPDQYLGIPKYFICFKLQVPSIILVLQVSNKCLQSRLREKAPHICLISV